MSHMTTPRKSIKRICVVCKTQNVADKNWRLINSEAGKQKNVSALLKKYGDIDVIEGFICRNCERRLVSLDKSNIEFRKQCNLNIHLLSGKRCIKEQENDENLPTAKRGSCIQLFEAVAVTTPFKERNFQNEFNFSGISPIFSSTPLLKQKYEPITPKEQNKTVDDGYSSFKSQCTVSFRTPIQTPAQTSSDSCENIDHSYCKQQKHQQSPKKKAAKKLFDVPKVLETLVKSMKGPESDLLTNSECALIQSSLPLRSRKELAKSILDIPAMKKTVKDLLFAELSQDNVVLRSRKHGKISQLMQKDYKHLQSFSWEVIVQELTEELPLLAEILLAVILPNSLSEAKRNERLASVLPRIGTVCCDLYTPLLKLKDFIQPTNIHVHV